MRHPDSGQINIYTWKHMHESLINELFLISFFLVFHPAGPNRKIKQSRPKSVMEDLDLFDKEEGYSQVARSQHLSQRSNSSCDIRGSSGVPKNRSISDLVKKKSSNSSHRNQQQALPPAQRRSNFIEMDTDESLDSGRDAPMETTTDSFSSQESTSGSALSQDSLPVMVSHKKPRVQRLEVEDSTPEDDSQESDDLPLNNSRTRGSRDELNASEVIDDFEDEQVYVRENHERNLDIDNPENARKSYRSAIGRVGSAASRLSQQQTFDTLPSRLAPTNEGPAMISEEEYTAGDDWLIDDMGRQPPKRKRMDVDGAFSTASSRTHTTEISSSSTSRFSRLSRKRKPRQTKLTSLLSNQASRIPSVIQEEDEDNISNSSSDVEMIPESPIERRVPDIQSSQRTNTNDNGHISQSTQEQRPPAVGGTAMRVKVKIQDKMFLIPVPTRYVKVTYFQTLCVLCK